MTLTQEFSQLDKLGSDVNKRLDAYGSERSRLDEIDAKFQTLSALSSSVDKKIQDLTTTSDNLLTCMPASESIRKALLMSRQIDRIENKGTTIDRVADEVDQSFENIKELESRLEVCSKRVQALPDEISDVRSSIDKLMSSTGKINDAVDKLSSLQKIIDDTDKRIDKINTARNGIAGTEERLQKLASGADAQMKLLHDIVKADVSKTPLTSGTSGGITQQVRENIIKLKRENWTLAEIARSLNLTESEVSLILELGA